MEFLVFLPKKSQKYVILVLKSIQWTLLIILTFTKDSPGGALDSKKSKQTLKLKISLLLVRPQGAKGSLQIRNKPKNSIF